MLQLSVTIPEICNVFVTVNETGVLFRTKPKKSLSFFKGKRIP